MKILKCGEFSLKGRHIVNSLLKIGFYRLCLFYRILPPWSGPWKGTVAMFVYSLNKYLLSNGDREVNETKWVENNAGKGNEPQKLGVRLAISFRLIREGLSDKVTWSRFLKEIKQTSGYLGELSRQWWEVGSLRRSKDSAWSSVTKRKGRVGPERVGEVAGKCCSKSYERLYD